MTRYVLSIILLIQLTYVHATPKAEDVVMNFGKNMSEWCKTSDFSYVSKIENICTGSNINFRAEDRLLSLFGHYSNSTFTLSTYLIMMEHMIDDNIQFELSNLRLEKEVQLQNGVLQSFITADMRISGVFNYTVRKLFIIRNEQITGIYDCFSETGAKFLERDSK